MGDLGGGHEGALARLAEEHAVRDEAVERLARGHAADAEVLREVSLRGHLRKRPELSRFDLSPQFLVDLDVERDRRCSHDHDVSGLPFVLRSAWIRMIVCGT